MKKSGAAVARYKDTEYRRGTDIQIEDAFEKAAKTIRDMMKSYGKQARGTKHPRGATKQTVAARKKKNRSKAKANRRSR